ncbi:hypothetical protein ACWC09_26395 [Streptomyces sp. NPDC001617]
MNQQYPPQQPYGQQPPPWGQPPQPPKKTGVGKILGLGCLGVFGLFVAIAVIAALAGGGGSSKSAGSGAVTPAPASSSASTTGRPAVSSKPKTAATPKKTKPASKPAKKTVVFKVWGTAPAGALGPLDITYGSDTDNRKGTFRNGTFTATLPLNDDAMYYDVTAQLQGSGDIQCSVTVDGHTKKGHASGDFNI